MLNEMSMCFYCLNNSFRGENDEFKKREIDTKTDEISQRNHSLDVVLISAI